MDVDIGEKQIQGVEQKVVLEALASMAARPGCLFLEVGSWCGDTSAILARIAREHGGHLVCVDWWKGSPGTGLAEIAKKKDVYAYFWNRMKEEGLEDTVMPLRGPSKHAAGILKEGLFDLVFIDADHTYAGISSDINSCAPLVRKGGVLCGHDCEGRVSDYDLNFLLSGKEKNFHESVHCGVVLAVGEKFKDYSVNYNIWSVRKGGVLGWKAAAPCLGKLKDKRQLPPIPIGLTSRHIVMRYGKSVYAAPRRLVDFDPSEEALRDDLDVGVVKAATIVELEAIIGQKVEHSDARPVLSGQYRDFNFLRFNGRYWAMSKTLGNVDLAALDPAAVKGLEEKGLCAAAGVKAGAEDWNELKRLVDELMHLCPVMREEGYRGFNIVVYKKMFYAFSQELGTFDIKTVDEATLAGLTLRRRCAVAATHEEIRRLVDDIAPFSGAGPSEAEKAGNSSAIPPL